MFQWYYCGYISATDERNLKVIQEQKSQLDYSLTNLTLLTSVTTFDLKNTMQEISYNEDIFNNVLSVI